MLDDVTCEAVRDPVGSLTHLLPGEVGPGGMLTCQGLSLQMKQIANAWRVLLAQELWATTSKSL